MTSLSGSCPSRISKAIATFEYDGALVGARPMAGEGLYCASAWLSSALRVIESHGIEPKRWLASRASLRNGFHYDESLAPIALIREAWVLAEVVSGSALIGAQTGFASFNPASWQSLGLGIICSDSLKDGLSRLANYYSMLTNIGQASVVTAGSDVSLVIETVCPPSELGDSAIEFGAAALVRAMRQISPSTVPGHISLPRYRYPHAAALEEMFECPIEFGCDRMVVSFERAAAERRINDVDPHLAKVQDVISESQCDQLRGSSIYASVQKAIVTSLPDGPPTLDHIARFLNISSRTLQRRLTAERKTFSQAVQDVLKQLSYFLVSDSDLLMKEITFAVGFADPACFTRAFRHWHGSSPAELRRSMRRQ